MMGSTNRDRDAGLSLDRNAGDTTYDRIAFFYDLLDAPYEYAWRRPLRRMMFAGLSGRILDAGAGTGPNLPFYPAGAEMHAIDVSRKMLDRAPGRLRRPRPVPHALSRPALRCRGVDLRLLRAQRRSAAAGAARDGPHLPPGWPDPADRLPDDPA